MDNNDIEQLIALIGEQFYEHIEEKYGKSVVKILRYHDIDSYTILNQVSKQELIDLFEKPDDENSTNELMNLKKDICNISQDSISMKVGTKNKLILLLKLTQDIVKKKRFQLVSEARLKRLDQYRSTSSSSTNNNDSDIENNFGKYHESVEESIGKLLIKLNKNIHGITNTNVSVNNFKISVEHTNNLLVPICSVQCICGDRVKLYFKHNQFQLSNFIKHIKTINNKRAFIINDGSEELDDPQVSYQMDFDNQVSKNENNRSINHNSSGTSIRIDTGDSDTLTPTTLKKTQSQNPRILPDNNEYSESTVASSKNRRSGQSSNRTLPKDGETNSSISIISPINKRKQMLNSQQRQTTNAPSNYQHVKSFHQQVKSVHQQNLNQNNLSQSKKRKYDENEKQTKFDSSTKSNKRISNQEISWDNINPSDILCTLLNTIDLNRHRSPNNYRYPNPVLRFAACLFILAGVYVYEFLRLNFKFLLPSIQTIKNVYKQNPYSEAKFRFDESKVYLDSIKCQFVFLSEDCSAIIPRIEYDSTFNSFNGFVTPVIDGKPMENAFNCQSFEEFKDFIENHQRANLVNVHLLQPISDSNSFLPSATVLSAYGTDNKVTSIDILKRWLMIYLELRARNICVLGFSTDGDPKYLRSMRLASGFFVKHQTLNIYNDQLSFTIKIPSSWYSWYFLNPTQLFLFMQDGIHLCTKMRNRFLSRNVCLQMGRYKVSVKHLYQLIETRNKIDHNLSKSDMNIKDKQNFSSCQRISDDKVLNLLSSNDEYNATYNYLLLINLLIIAYTQPRVSLSTRIFYAWIILFFIRLWRIWLYKSKKARRSFTQSDRSYFITSNALLSIELNAHSLIYIYLLIEQKLIPESAANSINLFSSQPCESIFRDARALSGIYSTRINFTMKQFLERINKLNALTELKQFESGNQQEKIIFPIHHKIKRTNKETEFNTINEDVNFNADNVETIIFQAYEAAQEMVVSVGMDKILIKHKLFNIEESSKMAEELLRLNTLTESEILVLDGRDDENSDEEDGFIPGEEEEDDDEDDEEDEQEEVNDDNQDIHAEDGDDEDEVEDLIQNVYHNYSSEDDQRPTSTFENIQTTSYSGLRLVPSIPSTNVHKYFSINMHNKNMFLHKATAAWYMQDRQARIPSDRLQRVQLKET